MSGDVHVPDEVKQWKIGMYQSGAVLTTDQWKEGSERNFNILNLKKNGYFTWQEQPVGVNLGWTKDTSEATARKDRRWWFKRKDGSVSPLLYGERFALGRGAGASFLRYAHRTIGINLSFEQNPEFEWAVYGGATGSPVNTNVPIAIFNTRVERGGENGDFMMYFDRPVGGDIGWITSPTLWGQLAPHLKTVVEKAIKVALS
jgi:hypothetical protein